MNLREIKRKKLTEMTTDEILADPKTSRIYLKLTRC